MGPQYLTETLDYQISFNVSKGVVNLFQIVQIVQIERQRGVLLSERADSGVQPSPV